MSQLWRNQPDSFANSSAKRAVDWIEYIAGNPDLRHLQSPLANVPFRVIYSVDMILALAFTVIGFWAIFFKHMVLDKKMPLSGQRKGQPTDEDETTTSSSSLSVGNGQVEGTGNLMERQHQEQKQQQLTAITEEEVLVATTKDQRPNEADDVTDANDVDGAADKKNL